MTGDDGSGPELGDRFDVLVIGAGFSGLYMLHRLRQLGLRTRVLEMAENVGGTWLFNRYPGARCDIESIEYSYSFSEEIQQEWVWTESMPAQPEIEAYLNFVADRLDLRRDIQFDTLVVAMAFDEEAAAWVVQTERGEILRCAIRRRRVGHPVGAAGTRDPRDWRPSPERHCPPAAGRRDGFDLAGKRVGVIGTGSTGVQLDPGRGPGSPAALRVPAFRGIHPAVAGAPIRARRAGRDEGQLRRNPGGPAGTPDRGRAAERLLGAARDARQPAAQIGVAGRAIARHRGARRVGRAELGRRLLRHRGQPDGRQAVRRGGGPDRQGPGDRGGPGARLSLRVQAADHRPGLLRDLQPRQRHAGRPAQGPDPRGDADRHPHRARLLRARRRSSTPPGSTP